MAQVNANDKEQVRRQKILQAAVRIFKREGLSKASMRSIALEAGCTTGAIYPIFAGKEDIYASLLEDSLKRLHSRVAEASASEADAFSALFKAANAFFDYYAVTRFELDLGLYLFGEEKAKSLGRDRDTVLNASLFNSLDIFTACFRRLAPPEKPENWPVNERDALFSVLLGALMLSHTGRATSIGTQAKTILLTYLRGVEERIVK